VKYRLDIDSLHRVPARTLARGEIGVCTVATHTPLVVEGFARDHDADRFTLSDLYTDEMIAAGTVDFALRRGINIHWQPLTVTKEVRASLKEQRPCVVWFTGLSGAGKSTIANLVEGWLALHGCHTYLLDGDNVRHGLNKDLGFTAADRVENIRRVGEVARLFVDAGVIVLCSFISPFRAEREAVRSIVDEGEFIEIHVTAPLEVCERRDPKGLYAKSRAGQLPNFTGIDSPYEAPEHPDLVLDTTSAPAAELAQRVVALLQVRGVVMTSDVEMRMAGGV
jgi:bifunctional enzyme CysN/CysC